MSMVPIMAAFAGFALGWIHFASLSRVADLFVAGRLSAVALQVARLAALGAFFWIGAQQGAVTLIAGAAGVLAARQLVLRRAR